MPYIPLSIRNHARPRAQVVVNNTIDPRLRCVSYFVSTRTSLTNEYSRVHFLRPSASLPRDGRPLGREHNVITHRCCCLFFGYVSCRCCCGTKKLLPRVGSLQLFCLQTPLHLPTTPLPLRSRENPAPLMDEFCFYPILT